MVTFINSHQEGIVLPATALVQEEDHTYVYKRTGNERFVKTLVNITSGDNGNVIVLDGIVAGDTVISEGCIYIQ
jgi:cobalt-zinc-cadmium efflux system membrane fusion protein